MLSLRVRRPSTRATLRRRAAQVVEITLEAATAARARQQQLADLVITLSVTGVAPAVDLGQPMMQRLQEQAPSALVLEQIVLR